LRPRLRLMALGQVNLGITETGITGVGTRGAGTCEFRDDWSALNGNDGLLFNQL
jgi:hypothetical protein